MIETNKCPKCLNVFTVEWEDREEIADEEDENSSIADFDEEESYPQYCPFCGTHREYCGEDDLADDF